mmetsp:Transcript_3658/g.8832  ORF Transcript_3658/g.8832 Transcript_3658/m.8832 type:complete len:314 (-) Transcript_3658:1281-2222(-)|eukprot:CAMPEP_0113461216 /NCGR_PEP_ID=MMETSP0014_2-20120614/11420_1 /TAXON_ID=2857 /ORGANISM="Nitzschia sp." /LENGTH=313 /DNA_ID=CAMNT_0000352957 /DNA_START=150 /DNA_END=1091 /DNA_ORIENTATION=- /assembly_acc=CAM_ASM_000159
MAKKCCCSAGSGGNGNNDQTPLRADECMCGCGYLNGPFQVIIGQLLLLCGFMFSIAAAGDCAFVETAVPVNVFTSELDGQGQRVATKLGFFMYENSETQYCYYWSDNSFASIEDQIDFYINNVLGPDWFQPLNLAWAATSVSFLFFLYVTSYCCSAQIRPFRFCTGVFIGIVIVVFQGLAFLVYDSQWCETYQCSFGRSAGFAVGAATCFFLSGIMWCMTKDYPGADAAAASAAAYGGTFGTAQQQDVNNMMNEQMESGGQQQQTTPLDAEIVEIDPSYPDAPSVAVTGMEDNNVGGASGSGDGQSPKAWQTY